MSRDDLRRRAAAVRDLPLEIVLMQFGAIRDEHDHAKWHTERGCVSITGPKFMNWHDSAGGGGAIDLVMHLAGVDFAAALRWLEQSGLAGSSHLAARTGAARLGNSQLADTASADRKSDLRDLAASGVFRPPIRDDRRLGRVRDYLTNRRHLSAAIVEHLVTGGMVYADRRGNAVFLLVRGKAQSPVGAELRGTGRRAWRGMAGGSSKDSGYFWIGSAGSRQIVLCESAIDAVSCYQLTRDGICISTAGVRSAPPWLPGLIGRGYRIFCGFDADDPGDLAASRMISCHPAIQRLRPSAHDWNEVLAASHTS